MRTSLLASVTLALLGAACSSPAPAGDDDGDRPDATVANADPDATPRPDPDAMPPDAAVPDPDAAFAVDAAPIEPSCASWLVDLDTAVPDGTVRSATIADGALALSVAGDREGTCSSNLEPCNAITLYQGQLQGDFDVSLAVGELDGASPFDQVSLVTTTGFGGMFTMYDQVSVGAGSLFVVHRGGGSPESWSTGTATTEAALRITRTGGDVTLSAITAGSTLSKTYSGSGDVYVAITLDAIGSSTLDPSVPVTARIDDFTVTGGGGAIVSDSFDEACTLVPG